MVMAPYTNKHDMGISLIDYGWLMVDEKNMGDFTNFTRNWFHHRIMVVNLTKNAISYQT
jgi:hypothetical protein